MPRRSCGPSLGRPALTSDFDKPFDSAGASGAFIARNVIDALRLCQARPECYINNTYTTITDGPHPLAVALSVTPRAQNLESNFDASAPQLKAVETELMPSPLSISASSGRSFRKITNTRRSTGLPTWPNLDGERNAGTV